MTYLILQILFCLLIAFLLGLLLGWLLGRASCSKNTHEQKTVQVNPVKPTPLKETPPAPLPSKSTTSFAAGTTQTPPPPPPPVKKEASVATPPPPPPSKPAAAQVTGDVDLDTAVNLNGKGYEIETLEGVGPKTGIALRDININTIADFLKNGHLASQRSSIAAKIAVRPKMVDSWASMSDLLRVDGVDHQAAELMHKSGLKTVADLAKQDSSSFITKMEETNTAGKRSIAPEVPSTDSVNSWIDQAKSMKAVVEA